MKKLLSFFFMAFAAVSLNGCGGSDSGESPEPGPGPNPGPTVEVTKDAISGEWVLSAWSGGALPASTQIYLKVDGDNSFKLYQKNVNYAGVVLFQGTYTLDEANALISGRYSDGVDWGSSYSLFVTANTMKWTVSGKNESSTFTRETIPAEIIDTAVPSGDVVRSMDLFRLL